MSLSCNCPLPSAIASIPAIDCPTSFGQIQKIGLQRVGDAFDGTLGNDITLLADWQTRTSAVDDTKIVVSPFMVEFAIAPGDAITIGGGDNTTLNGESQLVGVNPSSVTAKIQQAPADVIQALMDLRCEKSLVVYLFNDAGKIIAFEVATDSFKGLPISSFFASDRANDGFGTIDYNNISFNLKKDWSATAVVITPADFNPLTDL